MLTKTFSMRFLTRATGLSLTLMFASGLGSAAIAHQVQTTESIGATLHIEPNDIPKARVPTQVWFALTQPGGVVVPLAHCACALTIYDSANQAIANPPLVPITAEGYDAIPSAEVEFPTVGAYTLVLAGQPQGDASFDPFELRFNVTVASAGTPPATDSIPEPVPEESAREVDGAISETPASPTLSQRTGQPAIWSLVGIVGVGLLWGTLRRRKE